MVQNKQTTEITFRVFSLCLVSLRPNLLQCDSFSSFPLPPHFPSAILPNFQKVYKTSLQRLQYSFQRLKSQQLPKNDESKIYSLRASNFIYWLLFRFKGLSFDLEETCSMFINISVTSLGGISLVLHFCNFDSDYSKLFFDLVVDCHRVSVLSIQFSFCLVVLFVPITITDLIVWLYSIRRKIVFLHVTALLTQPSMLYINQFRLHRFSASHTQQEQVVSWNNSSRFFSSSSKRHVSDCPSVCLMRSALTFDWGTYAAVTIRVVPNLFTVAFFTCELEADHALTKSKSGL